MCEDLSGRNAVITGAGGVLCGGFAKALASHGVRVALLDLNLEAAQAVADAITAEGGFAKAYRVDVLDQKSTGDAAAQIAQDFGHCHILLNGAGGNNPRATTDREYHNPDDLDGDIKSFFDLDPKGVEFVFSLNFLGTLIPSQCFAKNMGEGDVIINISSMSAYSPLTKTPAYSAAKAAISNFTQWMAVHFSHVGIRVNAIAPGFFSTAQNRDLLYNPDGSPTERTGKILAATPMGRLGQPEELVGALEFLVSGQAASFVTGAILPVDGGFSAYSGV